MIHTLPSFPQQPLFPSIVPTSSTLSFWDQAQLMALLLQVSVSWILTALLQQTEDTELEKNWCWVNLNKIRAKKPYQLIGVRNSDSREFSRRGFLRNFTQMHFKWLRKVLSIHGHSQWSKRSSRNEIFGKLADKLPNAWWKVIKTPLNI